MNWYIKWLTDWLECVSHENGCPITFHTKICMSTVHLMCVCSYFLALRGVTLNGGPGGPIDLGNRSTHIIRRPWWTAPMTNQKTGMDTGPTKNEQKSQRTHGRIFLLPALCRVAAGCIVVWSPHVQVQIPVSSRCGGTVAPSVDRGDVWTHFCPLKTHTQTHTHTHTHTGKWNSKSRFKSRLNDC